MYRILRALIAPLAALVFLAGAIGVALVTMAFQEPPRGEEAAAREWGGEAAREGCDGREGVAATVNPSRIHPRPLAVTGGSRNRRK
jgi:hypothetical protein